MLFVLSLFWQMHNKLIFTLLRPRNIRANVRNNSYIEYVFICHDAKGCFPHDTRSQTEIEVNETLN